MQKFQVIILVTFIVFAAIGVFVFATFEGGNSGRSNVQLTIWGDEDSSLFSKFMIDFKNNIRVAGGESFNVKYVQIESEKFVEEVVNALASGTGPDIITLSSENILKLEDKIFAIPYEVVSERNFRDAFIEGGEIFLTPSGILGLPFKVDPLITYWNRDIFQSNKFSSPPKFWSEFFPLVDRITQKDQALNITRSAVALGEYGNVNNAKEIIIGMLFQNENEVIKRNAKGEAEVIISDNFGKTIAPSESVVRFYTEFSNPAKTSYSWNRSLPNSTDAFSSGDLALYFGFASELESIVEKNPNLNFDISIFPQPTDDVNKKTYGKMKAFAVMKRSPNIDVSMSLISALIREDNINSYSAISGLPPVRRSLLARKPGSAFGDLFYESAIISKAFLDPNAVGSEKVFEELINRVVSGRERISAAIKRSDTELNDLIKNN
jgi:ABC-type glycerol-3-phosphate transport system substrate-binding protein